MYFKVAIVLDFELDWNSLLHGTCMFVLVTVEFPSLKYVMSSSGLLTFQVYYSIH